MECPSCTFQNIPGTQECVRCRTLLNLEAVDFIPPRAASWRMGRRVAGAWRRAWYWWRAEWANMGIALRVPVVRGLGLRHVAMALAPGLPQIRSGVLGMRVLGWTVLAIWCAMLILAGATVGSGLSVLLCFGMVSVHCFSISLMLTPALQTTPLLVRIVVGISMYFVVLFGEYWPVRMAIGTCVHVLPVEGIAAGPVVRNGDVLAYSGALTRPGAWKPGDLVVSVIEGQGAAHGEAQWILEGVNVDRVVAVAGQDVAVRQGVMLVDGEEIAPELGPLRHMANLPDWEVRVPERSVVVFPSTLMSRGLAGATIENMSIVPDANVLGKVMFRVRPWKRAGRVGGDE